MNRRRSVAALLLGILLLGMGAHLVIHGLHRPPTQRGVIRFDNQSGILVPRKVWAVDAGYFQSGIGEPYVYALDVGAPNTYREVHDCPLDRRHITDIVFTTIPVELCGSRLADFVPSTGMPLIIVS